MQDVWWNVCRAAACFSRYPAWVRRGAATAHRKERVMCEEEDQYIQFMAARATLPPLTSGDTLHWDGGGAESQGVELTQGAAPGACAVLPVHGQLATGYRAFPCVPTKPLGLLPSLPVPAIDWARAAASLGWRWARPAQRPRSRRCRSIPVISPRGMPMCRRWENASRPTPRGCGRA